MGIFKPDNTLSSILHIKNVVYKRCLFTVSTILKDCNIPFSDISLGEVVLKRPLSKDEKLILNREFKKVGFEILEERNKQLVHKIKSIIISNIYEEDVMENRNLSALLSEKLHFDYSHLSTLFSLKEGKSIQQFQQSVKIERIKELLEYDELSIIQIAENLHFGSGAYLSTLFKKETGLTPSQYKQSHVKNRKSLDSA